jgi:hypothetical protein
MERRERHTDRKTYWRKVVAAWKASGLTKKAFCEQKQINYYSLLRWNKRLAGETGEEGEQFVEVPATIGGPPATTVNAKGPIAGRIEIVTGAVVVRVPAGVEREQLQMVLSAVEQVQC